tara:strand:+ start:533 stop:814 length:282 start_codon:yes stop_codon:yes gene_type:complete
VFLDHHNHQRLDKSINNVTPADVYFGRDKAILHNAKGSSEKHSKRDACITARKPHNQTNQMSQTLSYVRPLLVPKTLTTDIEARSLHHRKNVT